VCSALTLEGICARTLAFCRAAVLEHLAIDCLFAALFYDALPFFETIVSVGRGGLGVDWGLWRGRTSSACAQSPPL
jgi:hypothetical protein